MNTVALLLMATMAFPWICVFGGRTPLARRVRMDLGRLRSCKQAWLVSVRVLEQGAGTSQCTRHRAKRGPKVRTNQCTPHERSEDQKNVLRWRRRPWSSGAKCLRLLRRRPSWWSCRRRRARRLICAAAWRRLCVCALLGSSARARWDWRSRLAMLEGSNW